MDAGGGGGGAYHPVISCLSVSAFFRRSSLSLSPSRLPWLHLSPGNETASCFGEISKQEVTAQMARPRPRPLPQSTTACPLQTQWGRYTLYEPSRETSPGRHRRRRAGQWRRRGSHAESSSVQFCGIVSVMSAQLPAVAGDESGLLMFVTQFLPALLAVI